MMYDRLKRENADLVELLMAKTEIWEEERMKNFLYDKVRQEPIALIHLWIYPNIILFIIVLPE